MNQPSKDSIYTMSVIITFRDNGPCIELRKKFTNFEAIKRIISSAWHDRPIIVMPQFRNKLKAIASLQEKGILYEDNGKYFFMF